MTKKLSYTFSYRNHERDSFEEWLVPTLLAGTHQNGIFTQLERDTDGWQNVVLSISINGVEVDAKHMIDSLKGNFEHAIARSAKSAVDDALADLGIDEFHNIIFEVRQAAEDAIRTRLAARGIDLPIDDDGY